MGKIRPSPSPCLSSKTLGVCMNQGLPLQGYSATFQKGMWGDQESGAPHCHGEQRTAPEAGVTSRIRRCRCRQGALWSRPPVGPPEPRAEAPRSAPQFNRPAQPAASSGSQVALSRLRASETFPLPPSSGPKAEAQNPRQVKCRDPQESWAVGLQQVSPTPSSQCPLPLSSPGLVVSLRRVSNEALYSR